MRFSEIPVHDDSIQPTGDGPTTVLPPSPDLPAARPDGKENPASEGSSNPKKRTEAAKLIESIGTEFSRLRKSGRSGAWADLEDKVAKSGHVLTDSGMMSVKDWVGMMIDIEQFRKAEGGTSEMPGDALASWLSEGMEKPKQKKAKVQ